MSTDVGLPSDRPEDPTASRGKEIDFYPGRQTSKEFSPVSHPVERTTEVRFLPGRFIPKVDLKDSLPPDPEPRGSIVIHSTFSRILVVGVQSDGGVTCRI